MNAENARITLSMDKDWSFHLGNVDNHVGVSHNEVYGRAKAGACAGVPQSDFVCDDKWEIVNIPHDWSVKQPFDTNGSPSWGYKPKGVGWYRKSFYMLDEYKGKQLSLTFEGVAKNCVVYYNGSVLYRHFSAYEPFTVDITDRTLFGNTPNTLAVYVDATEWEGWWYEGAGIYRHIRLDVKSKVNIAENGIFVKPQLKKDKWVCEISADIQNCDYKDKSIRVLCEIINKQSGEKSAEYKFETFASAYAVTSKSVYLYIENPQLWDIDSPNLYECRISVLDGDKVLDNDSVNFGFRTIDFTPDKGFFLNGRNVKLFGTCNHQDHGGIGVAVPDSIHEYRISRLKEMGSNAYRCAHGMPHKELLDACDKLGMLVMDENRNFESSDECLGQLRTMVKRDRNHPSVIMYSIFNEEPLQSTPEGAKMAEKMSYEIRRLDDTRFVTGAMNGGVTEDDGCVNVLDVCGANYQIWTYEKFHEKFPDKCFIGSETTSTFAVRDCYKTDKSKNEISCYDENPADWGNTVRQTWAAILKNDFCAGGFMWTGFDYLGEPTPHVWPSVSSFFGMMDICGFPKDAYYLCQAIFKNEPVVHVLPHWNFKGHEGEIIRVMSHTNCEEAELFVNDKSHGKKKIVLTEQAYWEVPFEAGSLKLVGYNGGEKAGECVRETAGEAVKIKLVPYRDYMYDNGLDAIPVNIIAYDEQDREVTDAEFEVELTCEGGDIIGTSNGNPNSHEDFTSSVRHLFHGKAQAVIQCKQNVNCLTLSGKCGKIKCEKLCVAIKQGIGIACVPSSAEIVLNSWRMSAKLLDEKPDVSVKFAESDMNSLEPVSFRGSTQEKFNGQKGKFALYRTTADIPEKINGKSPFLHFNSLCGDFEFYIDGEYYGHTQSWWGGTFDINLENMAGKREISVICKCEGDGAGICSTVVIR